MRPLSGWKVHELRSAITNPEADLQGYMPDDILAEMIRRHKADVLELAATTILRAPTGTPVLQLAEKIRKLK